MCHFHSQGTERGLESRKSWLRESFGNMAREQEEGGEGAIALLLSHKSLRTLSHLAGHMSALKASWWPKPYTVITGVFSDLNK